MSERWPPLNLPNPNDGIPSQRHRHDAQDITGIFADVVLAGDLWSSNWDGGHDLSAGRDATATLGYFLDSSCGAAQFVTIYADGGQLRTLTITGTLTLSGSGKIITAASGQRVELVATSGTDMLLLYSGDAGETPGAIYPLPTSAPDSRLSTILRSPRDAIYTTAAVITLMAGAPGGNIVRITGDLVTASGYDLGTAVEPWGSLYADCGALTGSAWTLPGAYTIDNAADTSLSLSDTAAVLRTWEGGAWVNRVAVNQAGTVVLRDTTGAAVLTADTALITCAQQVRITGGTAADPALYLYTDSTSGFYRPTLDVIGVSAGGTGQVKFTDGAFLPITNNDIDLGSATLTFKNSYLYNLYDEAGTLRLDLDGDWTPAGDILPATDVAQDLGSAAKSFQGIYAQAIYDESGNQILDTSAGGGAGLADYTVTTYTPTIAGSTGGVLGNGTVNGWYRQLGKMVWGELRFVWGSTTTFTGTLTATYPVTAIGYGATVSVGSGRVITGGAANAWLVDTVHNNTTTMGFRYDQQTGGGTVTATAPAAFAANDVITVHFHYTAA